MITISIGPEKDPEALTKTISSKGLVLLGTGIAVGIILKQKADIRSLNTTVKHLQEIIR